MPSRRERLLDRGVPPVLLRVVFDGDTVERGFFQMFLFWTISSLSDVGWLESRAVAEGRDVLPLLSLGRVDRQGALTRRDGIWLDDEGMVLLTEGKKRTRRASVAEVWEWMLTPGIKSELSNRNHQFDFGPWVGDWTRMVQAFAEHGVMVEDLVERLAVRPKGALDARDELLDDWGYDGPRRALMKRGGVEVVPGGLRVLRGLVFGEPAFDLRVAEVQACRAWPGALTCELLEGACAQASLAADVQAELHAEGILVRRVRKNSLPFLAGLRNGHHLCSVAGRSAVEWTIEGLSDLPDTFEVVAERRVGRERYPLRLSVELV